MNADNNQDSPTALLESFMTGESVTRLLCLTVELGVADMLVEGPRPVEQIAQACGVGGSYLYRVLRALVGHGIFSEPEPGWFGLNPAAELLRKDVPDSQQPWLLLRAQDWMRRPWAALRHSIETGQPAFDHLYQQPFFDYLANNPPAQQVFDDAMSAMVDVGEAFVQAYDFSDARTVVDVGGGHGTLMISILSANDHLQGMVVDAPTVVEGTANRINNAGLAKRCTAVAGDFFSDVPSGGDIYILRHIIHDWDDDRATTILRNCHAAMAPGTRLLVLDTVLPPRNTPPSKNLSDITMLVLVGGKERTEDEFSALFQSSGFALNRVLQTNSYISVVEGVRV